MRGQKASAVRLIVRSIVKIGHQVATQTHRKANVTPLQKRVQNFASKKSSRDRKRDPKSYAHAREDDKHFLEFLSHGLNRSPHQKIRDLVRHERPGIGHPKEK